MGVLNGPQTRGKNYKKEEPQHANCVSRLSTGRGDRITTVCFAYYSLVDPMLRIRYPTSRSSLKTVHRTVFYASDLHRFESYLIKNSKPDLKVKFNSILCPQNLKREAETIKKKRLNYANCVSRLSTGRADTSKSELSADSSFNSSNVTVFVPS